MGLEETRKRVKLAFYYGCVMPFFDTIELLPDDPILSLPIAFAADSNPNKVNLGIGAYQDAEGKSFVLMTVKKAEEMLLKKNLSKEYLPIEGNGSYIKESLKLLFGDSDRIHKGEVFAAQTIGGTGALRLGGEFLTQELTKTIFLSDPTWPNHRVLFSRAGFRLESYAYYDEQRHVIDFKRMTAAIGAMPAGSAILLHACCHNPTGIDPTPEQWQELSHLIKQQNLIPFFDIAYQGFGKGLKEDAYPIRLFANEGHEMVVASSYSKNFGLYGERVGVLTVFTHGQEATKRVASQIKQIIRGNYSNPPLHGSRIVATILQSPELKKEWEQELSNMRDRVNEMRIALIAGLAVKSSKDFSFLQKQLGIFSFCGLNKDQVHRLRQEKGIYMPANGRINVAGLNSKNVDYVVESIIAVTG